MPTLCTPMCTLAHPSCKGDLLFGTALPIFSMDDRANHQGFQFPSQATIKSLTAQAQKMAHINTFIAMWPSFRKMAQNPHGSIDLGDRYLLLRPTEEYLHHVTSKEEEALDVFCSSHQDSEGVDWGSFY